MVKRAHKVQAIALPKPADLSTTISLREVMGSKMRLEAASFAIDARKAVESLRASGLDLVPLHGPTGLCQHAHNAYRFKRIWVGPGHGVPFFNGAEVISMRPRASGYISRKLTEKLNELFVEQHQVLVTRSGTVGNVGLCNKTLAGSAVTEDVIRISCADKHTAGYIAAFLRTKYGRLQLRQESYGSVVTHIEPDHLKNIVIPDLHPLQRGEIGKLFLEAAQCRDDANDLIDASDILLHERLKLPWLSDSAHEARNKDRAVVKASALMGRLEASYHDPLAMKAEKNLTGVSFDVASVGDRRVTKEVRAVTKFRKRVYVPHGGIPMLSSKQLFQIAPVDVKRLAKGAHTKDLKEIALKRNMVAVTCSGTIGRIQIIPAYMEGWTANQHATRLIPADEMNPGYLYAWLSSDYGQNLLTRHSYGSVILEIDRDMIASVPVALPSSAVTNEIGDLVLKANELRHEAWNKEKKAIQYLEGLIQKTDS